MNSGHLLENLVFISLRRHCSCVYYYKTNGGREVDFIVIREDRSKQLIQVCESLANEQTKKRETTALFEAMDELSLSQAVIVTRDEEDQLQHEGKVISVMPVWRFLLELSAKTSSRAIAP